MADVGIIQRRTESQGVSVTGLGFKTTLSYTMPEGYTRLAGIFFNPAFDILLTLRSQRAQTNILTNFSTAIGNYGWLPSYTKQLQTDILNLSLEVLAMPGVGFPYTVTFSLAYE